MQDSLENIYDNSRDISWYDNRPLPFPAIGDQPWTWADFDQDEEKQAVFLYRGLDEVDKKLVDETAYQSKAAALNFDSELAGREKVYENFGTADWLEIARRCSESFQGLSPILHTTLDRDLAESIARTGTLVIFKIPKEWLLNPKNSPLVGNIGEKELDFFYQLPSKFVDRIIQYGPDRDVLSDKELLNNIGSYDVIDSDNLPGPPLV